MDRQIDAGGPQLGGNRRSDACTVPGLASKNGAYDKRMSTNAGRVVSDKSAILCVTTLQIAQS